MSLGTVQGRVEEIVATMFNVPVDTVSLASSPATTESWDSMGHLMLVLEIEQQFGVQFAPEDVEEIADVRSIVDLVQRKQAV
jgi:acyl carrier protein